MATTVPTITGSMPTQTTANNDPHPLNLDTNATGTPVAVGDWIVVMTTSASGTAVRIPTFPSGWVTIREHSIIGASATTSMGIYAKIRQSGETTYTVTQSTNTNYISFRAVWGKGALTDISKWIPGAFTYRTTNATTTTAVAQAVTSTTANSLALLIAEERTVAAETDSQVTVSSGWTKYVTMLTNDQSSLFAYQNVASPGSVGPATVTYPNTHTYNGTAGILIIPPAPDTSPQVPTGYKIKRSNGTSLQDVYLKYSDGTQLLDFKGLKLAKPGYASVTQMLSQAEFFCAHRGGSRDFPEMSLMAYGQSVLWGYPALELSLARTMDGVWFGLHDASLDRTSYGTGGGSGTTYVASNLTWAQVQASPGILGNNAPNDPTQQARPYMRWEELMNMYYSTHVFFIDPKAAYTYRGELLDKMDSMPGNPRERFVGKYYGVVGTSNNTGTSWPIDLRARGYKGWGYFYEADQSNFAAYQGRWDILGMDYGASQASWDALKAARTANQPIMGHICPNPAAVATARSKGATGFMVSNVKGVLPPAVTPFGGFGATNFGSNSFGV